MTEPSPEPLISEHDDRDAFIGIDVVRTSTGEVESRIDFTDDEIDMPGYVEYVESGYNGTPWHTQRVWRSHTDPADPTGRDTQAGRD